MSISTDVVLHKNGFDGSRACRDRKVCHGSGCCTGGCLTGVHEKARIKNQARMQRTHQQTYSSQPHMCDINWEQLCVARRNTLLPDSSLHGAGMASSRPVVFISIPHSTPRNGLQVHSYHQEINMLMCLGKSDMSNCYEDYHICSRKCPWQVVYG